MLSNRSRVDFRLLLSGAKAGLDQRLCLLLYQDDKGVARGRVLQHVQIMFNPLQSSKAFALAQQVQPKEPATAALRPRGQNDEVEEAGSTFGRPL